MRVRVESHTARMTGAFWFVVLDHGPDNERWRDGSQVGPYYDDFDDATRAADRHRLSLNEPAFEPGDRVFTHYDMKWGTVESLDTTYRDMKHGVTGTPLPDTTWYTVKYDDGATSLLDDAHGEWDMARIVPPYIAERYDYGKDPRA
jgi:hypothetical protein